MKSESKNHVAVLGGGIAGLVSAYRLLRQGHRVTLFEATGELGGLGGTFAHEGRSLERFYHSMTRTDEHLLGLLRELGLGEEITWAETAMGILDDRKLQPCNAPLDLLRFRGIGLFGRLRAAWGAFLVAKQSKISKGLDRTSAADWLLDIFGAEAFAKLWRPLLRARFGEMSDSVPAYWLWSRLRREKTAGQVQKGHIRGGYRRVADRLAAEIRLLGGVIHLYSPVHAVEEAPDAILVTAGDNAETFDAAISTLPLPLLGQAARGRLAGLIPQQKLPYQGVVNAVVILKQRLQPNYAVAIARKDFPFQGLVESTHVVPRSQTGGRHLVHLFYYCGKDSETFRQTDGAVKFQALKSLKAFNPNFEQDWVEDIRVFRAPHVEPIWPLGFQNDKPRMRCGGSRLYLATVAQSYPNPNCWNTMTGIANDVAGRVQFDFQKSYPGNAATSAA